MRRGNEYLLERHLLRRLSDGEVIDPGWTDFHFPPWWRYDVLRGLEYLANAGDAPDERVTEALEVVRGNRLEDGRWTRHVHSGAVHFEIDDGEGEPSRWNTLRALRVLKWAGDGFNG
jgi:hypothetical protein